MKITCLTCSAVLDEDWDDMKILKAHKKECYLYEIGIGVSVSLKIAYLMEKIKYIHSLPPSYVLSKKEIGLISALNILKDFYIMHENRK